MALIKTGSIVADIAGKVGDNIYSRNKGGLYVKAMASPVIPASTYVTAVKTLMSDASAAWSALSESDYLAWKLFSEQYPRASFIDGYKKIDPRSLWIGCYINQFWCGITPNPQPIAPVYPGANQITVDVVNASTLNTTVLGGVANSDIRVLFYGGFGSSLAVRSINTIPTYIFESYDYDPGTTYNLSPAYDNRLGVSLPTEFERAFIKAKFVHKPSGLPVGTLWNQSPGWSISYPFNFGNDTDLGNNYALNTAIAQKFDCPASGTINTMSIFGLTIANGMTAAIYSDNAGVPDVLLASTNTIGSVTPVQQINFTLTAPLSVSAGSYWLAVGRTGIFPQIRSDLNTSDAVEFAGFSPPWTNPAPANAPIARNFSIFAQVDAP